MGISSTQTQLYIDGKFVDGTAGRTFPIYNPATEEKTFDIAEADATDVDIAVRAAEKAFPHWRDLSADDRADKCLKLAELIDRDRNEIAFLEAISMGLPISEYQGAINGAISSIKHAVGLSHDIHGETSLNTSGYVSFTLRQPLGVCAAIIPWNVPIIMFCGKLVPCIVAGNTLVLKSSEKAPLTSLKLASLCHEVGVPPGVVNVISGFGNIAGAALSTHMSIRKISFTGSTRTGKIISQAAAKSNMKRVSVETGGKNPAVIFEDADLSKAVPAVVASMHFNSGQICVSNSRIYVQDTIFSSFVEAFKEKFAAVQMGDPTDPRTHFGPQVDRTQFDSILQHIEDAKAEGAKVAIGGKAARDRGFFIQPTIFLQVPPNAAILRNEIFGPVVAIQQFKTEEEVLKLCNDTSYGLHASVFTRDLSRAYRMIKGFEAGMVTVNCSSQVGPYDLPFGGYKESGIGRENGKIGMDQYYEIKSVTIEL